MSKSIEWIVGKIREAVKKGMTGYIQTNFNKGKIMNINTYRSKLNPHQKEDEGKP